MLPLFSSLWSVIISSDWIVSFHFHHNHYRWQIPTSLKPSLGRCGLTLEGICVNPKWSCIASSPLFSSSHQLWCDHSSRLSSQMLLNYTHIRLITFSMLNNPVVSVWTWSVFERIKAERLCFMSCVFVLFFGGFFCGWIKGINWLFLRQQRKKEAAKMDHRGQTILIWISTKLHNLIDKHFLFMPECCHSYCTKCKIIGESNHSWILF